MNFYETRRSCNFVSDKPGFHSWANFLLNILYYYLLNSLDSESFHVSVLQKSCYIGKYGGENYNQLEKK